MKNVVYISILAVLATANGERVKDLMYEIFDGSAACFRRLNATHQTGCSSERGGSNGVIHFITDQSDLDFILKQGTAPPYMPVMPTHLFTPQTVNTLKIQTDRVSGIVLYNDSRPLDHYSHESVCPNQASNLESSCSRPWNKYGTDILNQDLPFPVYYVDNDEDLGKMRDCFVKFNNFSFELQHERSLCAIELDSFMYAAVDTPTCLRRSDSKTNLNPRKFCDPLGGINIWSSLFPIENSTVSKKYIVIAARMDTTSLFHRIMPGAVNPLTGLVTLLTAAHKLKKMFVNDTENYEKNVLFVLFNGETYDYIGSQRMVYDMEKNEFPLKPDPNIKHNMPLIHLEDIALFIELGQLSKTDSLYIHAEKTGNLLPFVNRLNQHNFTQLKVSEAIPPASLQSFLKARPNMSGLVIADHGDEFANRFYNSIYDNASSIGYQYFNGSEIPVHSVQQFIANVSEMVAASVYEEITDKGYSKDDREEGDVKIVDELFNCYLLDPDCRMHKVVQNKTLKDTPYSSYSLYVGVKVAPNILTYVIGLTLAWLTGDVVDTSNTTCKTDPEVPVYQYFNFSKGLDDLNTTLCFRTTMNYAEAVSPAFLIDDYDWKSGKYSSWSESTWKDLTVRMYLKPSFAHEMFTLATGCSVLAVSVIVVYFLKARSDVLFTPPLDCSPTNC